MEQMELRVLSSSITSNGDDLIVEGLVNQTGSWSHVLGKHKKFREQISKGAFDKAIKESRRIDFLGEHKQDLLLATTENGSLELWEDEQGLQMRAKIAPTSYGKDFYTLMSERLISHMSFGFKVVKDTWKKGVDGIYERFIEELELKEVSAVRNPAYPQSAIAARGIDLIEDVEIPVEIEEEEERSIDVLALKEELKKEILAELSVKEEVKVEEETKQEEIKTESDTNTEEIKNEVVKDDEKIKNDSESIQQEVTNEEEVKQEVVVEDKKDDKKEIVDLLLKYKEIQNLK